MRQKTLEQLRTGAAAHAAVRTSTWFRTSQLAARWGMCSKTVRRIPRVQLPYITVGTHRRYNPRDVARFEHARSGHTAEAVA